MMILVTGGAGRVGRRFVRRLVAEGDPVRVLVRGGEVAGAAGAYPESKAAAERPLEDPWAGIVDNRVARRDLGWRPIYASVYAAQDAGAL